MITTLVHHQIRRFERAAGYDASYLHELADASLGAFRRFAGVRALSYFREDVPLDAWYAAKIAATLAQDCGPCLQLNVTLGARDGLPAAQLRAMLTGDLAAMGDDAALVWRYARAVCVRDFEADLLREQIVRRWGRRALASVALQIAVAGLYPTLKVAFGHGKACSRIRVGEEDIVPRLAAGSVA
ncbi:MAG: hypothetical protein ACPHN2_03785 [Sinimarinibacterium flocculans]|uniref:hypothetical protein n=1 Tax=Sinimarinibacterium flocculans TaxID=985250 RepID=UPI003C400CF3